MVDALKKHDIKVCLLHFFEKVQQKQPLYQKVYSTNSLPEKQQTPPYSDILRIVTNERLTMLFFYSYRLFAPFNDFLIRRYRHSYGSLYKLFGALRVFVLDQFLFGPCNDIFAINLSSIIKQLPQKANNALDLSLKIMIYSGLYQMVFR